MVPKFPVHNGHLDNTKISSATTPTASNPVHNAANPSGIRPRTADG
jgi:hypothetical protein